jgi:hypothetical protein
MNSLHDTTKYTNTPMDVVQENIYSHCLARSLLFKPRYYGDGSIFLNSWQVFEGLLEFYGIGIPNVISSQSFDPTPIARAIFERYPKRIFSCEIEEGSTDSLSARLWNFWQMVGRIEKIRPEKSEEFLKNIFENCHDA